MIRALVAACPENIQSITKSQAFKNSNNKFENVQTYPEVFIVPNLEVPAITKHWKQEKRVMKGDLSAYLNRWELLC